MSYHISLERDSPPGNPPLSAGDIQPAFLETLPSEILTNIIERVLPKYYSTTYDVAMEANPKYNRYNFGQVYYALPPPFERRLPILYINKKMYAVALYILQARTFRIEFCERALINPVPLDEQIEWEWKPVFPGLDLTMIRELVIEITPTESRIFWHILSVAMKNLCKQQLLPRGPVKKLSVKVKDALWSCNRFSQLWEGLIDEPVRTAIAFEDYENVIQPFKKIIPAVGQCDIYLPYWTERHSGKDRIVEEWAKLGARVLFMRPGGPFSTQEGELGGRQQAELLPLPEFLLG